MDYQSFFQKAKEKQITHVQITEKEVINSSVEVIDGKMESFDNYHDVDYHIKGEYQNKVVSLHCNYLDDDIIDSLVVKAQMTDSVYEDDFLKNRENIPRRALVEFDISREIKRLKDLEKLKKNYPSVQKITSYFLEDCTNTRIINSEGVDISTSSHLCHYSLEAIVQNGEKFSSYDRQFLVPKKEDIPFEEMAEDVLKMAVIQSKKVKLETKKYDIVLDSYAAGNIISHLVGMLSLENVRKRMSCLEQSLNHPVFSKQLTIVEDPLDEQYPGYRLFDDEGFLTKKKIIVENGVIKTFLSNSREAKLSNQESTGNGYQKIDVRNMFVLSGHKNLDSLFQEMKNGIYIVDYMGSSNTSIHEVTGSISLQVFGFLVQDGKIVSGIEPAILTTTIFELLSNIKEIGDDLLFTNPRCASPSLLISNISIAG